MYAVWLRGVWACGRVVLFVSRARFDKPNVIAWWSSGGHVAFIMRI